MTHPQKDLKRKLRQPLGIQSVKHMLKNEKAAGGNPDNPTGPLAASKGQKDGVNKTWFGTTCTALQPGHVYSRWAEKYLKLPPEPKPVEKPPTPPPPPPPPPPAPPKQEGKFVAVPVSDDEEGEAEKVEPKKEPKATYQYVEESVSEYEYFSETDEEGEEEIDESGK